MCQEQEILEMNLPLKVLYKKLEINCEIVFGVKEKYRYGVAKQDRANGVS